MITRIHIVNGPNLNLLGMRQLDIYGDVSFEDYFDSIRGGYVMVQMEYYQSNHEGDLIDYLQEHGFEKNTGIILNAGGLTHTSVSLRDAVTAITTPVVEVHISDIHNREPFRAHSYLTDVCATSFIGKGMDGYRLAIEHLLAMPGA